MRHIEAAVAVILWASFLPAMFYVHNSALNCVIIVLVIGLMLHAYTMRPYCVEFDEEEEEAMLEMTMADPSNKTVNNSMAVPSNKDHQEERKLVVFLVTLLC